MRRCLVAFCLMLVASVFPGRSRAAMLPVTPECLLRVTLTDVKKELVSYDDSQVEDAYFFSLAFMVDESWDSDPECSSTFSVGQTISPNPVRERDLSGLAISEGDSVVVRIQGFQDEYSQVPWYEVSHFELDQTPSLGRVQPSEVQSSLDFSQEPWFARGLIVGALIGLLGWIFIFRNRR